MVSAVLNHVDQVRFLVHVLKLFMCNLFPHLQRVWGVQVVLDAVQKHGVSVFAGFQDGTAAVSESKIQPALLPMLLVGS